jgi:hypothetical protein
MSASAENSAGVLRNLCDPIQRGSYHARSGHTLRHRCSFHHAGLRSYYSPPPNPRCARRPRLLGAHDSCDCGWHSIPGRRFPPPQTRTLVHSQPLFKLDASWWFGTLSLTTAFSNPWRRHERQRRRRLRATLWVGSAGSWRRMGKGAAELKGAARFTSGPSVYPAVYRRHA